MPAEEQGERWQDPILQAHQTVRRCVRAMRGKDVTAALESLNELAQVLPEHFAYEEREGGFIDRLSHEVTRERLLQEHRDIHHELLTMVAMPPDAREWADQLLALADHLDDHESMENRMAAGLLSWDGEYEGWPG